MSAYIKTLKDLNGDTVFPQTLVSAVYDENSVPLPSKLNEIDEEIDNIKNSFTVVLPAVDWTAPTVALDDYTTSCRVSVPGMKADYNPKLFMNYLSTTQSGKIEEERGLSLIKDVITYDGYIIAYAYQAPSVDVQIKLAL